MNKSQYCLDSIPVRLEFPEALPIAVYLLEDNRDCRTDARCRTKPATYATLRILPERKTRPNFDVN